MLCELAYYIIHWMSLLRLIVSKQRKTETSLYYLSTQVYI